MSKCVSCGTDNPIDSQFCITCGARLRELQDTGHGIEFVHQSIHNTDEQAPEENTHSFPNAETSVADGYSVHNTIDQSEPNKDTSETEQSSDAFTIVGQWVVGALLITACCLLWETGVAAILARKDPDGNSSFFLPLILMVFLYPACYGRFRQITLKQLFQTLGLFLIPLVNLVYAPYYTGRGIKSLFWSAHKMRQELGLAEETPEDLESEPHKMPLWLLGFAITAISYITFLFLSEITDDSSSSLFWNLVALLFVFLFPIFLFYFSSLGIHRPVTFGGAILITFYAFIPIYGFIVVPYHLGKGAYRAFTRQELAPNQSPQDDS